MLESGRRCCRRRERGRWWWWCWWCTTCGGGGPRSEEGVLLKARGGNYRVGRHLRNPGWVDFDLDIRLSCPAAVPILPNYHLRAEPAVGHWNSAHALCLKKWLL